MNLLDKKQAALAVLWHSLDGPILLIQDAEGKETGRCREVGEENVWLYLTPAGIEIYNDLQPCTDFGGTIYTQLFSPPEMNLCVDGTSPDNTYQGDGKNPPFAVFDIDKQEKVAGPFRDRIKAESALLDLLRGYRQPGWCQTKGEREYQAELDRKEEDEGETFPSSLERMKARIGELEAIQADLHREALLCDNHGVKLQFVQYVLSKTRQ